jgi:hypothetical protein
VNDKGYENLQVFGLGKKERGRRLTKVLSTNGPYKCDTLIRNGVSGLIAARAAATPRGFFRFGICASAPDGLPTVRLLVLQNRRLRLKNN